MVFAGVVSHSGSGVAEPVADLLVGYFVVVLSVVGCVQALHELQERTQFAVEL